MKALAKDVKKWIVFHDESKVFVCFYLLLAVVLSIFLSLFWLVLVVFIHFVFEFVKQNQIDNYKLGVVLRAFWEVKLDVALVLFSLALVVYLDFVFGLAGINAAARVGGNVASRSGQIASRSGQIARMGRLSRLLSKIAGWQRVIRTIMMTIDDVFLILKALLMKLNDKKNNNQKNIKVDEITNKKEEEVFTTYGKWQQKWDFGDKFAVTFTVFCFLLFVVSPLLTGFELQEIWHLISQELKPFP